MENLSKNRIKDIQSLHQKKFRLKYNKFIVEGLKLTRELLLEKPQMVEDVYVADPEHSDILEPLMHGRRCHLISRLQIDQLSQMTTPPRVLAVSRIPEVGEEEDWRGQKSFYLDDIRDPGNMGTILRIADWFGIRYVLVSPESVDLYNHKVLTASMGSAFRVKTIEVSQEELFRLSEGKLYACDMSGLDISKHAPPEEGVLVFGNEGSGISDEILDKVTSIYSIPGDQRLGAESLNVASAVSVMAYWWKHK